ncbi:type I secretion C-terminal target domain-containing protein [Acinetobacter sp. 256-1]|uniref:type I secretion C-terminal target domain-containing protein n=1 Tax=Acinetobacter sp. 256-1 TaxID=2746721 RepID=UPI00257886AB|nr:type I secretion C-terminal target domain-containing protein [Acinetobacter sp. 256-1]
MATIGLGGVANVSALAFGSYIDVSVGDDQVRDLTLKADGGGISIGETHDLVILKEDEWGNWNVVQYHKDWFTIPLLGYIKTGDIRLDEPGNYKVYLAKINGVGVLSGSGLEITDDQVYDYSTVTAVSGSVSGNILTDINNQNDSIGSENGQDIFGPNVIIESITVGTEIYPIDQLQPTVIQGEYGTLTIEPNGEYTYTLNVGAKPPFGSVEQFNYTLKDTVTGETSSANLNISLNKEALVIDPVVQHLTLDVQSVVTPTNKLENVEQINVLGAGLGIADIKVATIEKGMTINVAEGHTREISFSSDGGAPIGIGTIPVSLAIYKYNETNQSWELYALKEDWYNLILAVTGGGASKENVDVLFTEGTYKAVTLSSVAGLAVLPIIVLKADKDTLYDHTQTSTQQQLQGDLTTGDYASFEMRSVNDQPVDGTPIQGKYGTLHINADGTYQYIVDQNTAANFGDIDTFSYSIKDPVTGKLATGTLNIQLDVVEAKDDQDNAKFGLDNIEDYTGWHVDERTANTSSVKEFSHEITVGKNQILDLQLAYAFDQVATSAKSDQYLIRLTNITTGEVVEILNTSADKIAQTVALPSLTEGKYKIDVIVDNSVLWQVDVKLDLTGTVTTLDGFSAQESNLVLAKGDLLANDIYYENQIASLKIQGQTLAFDKYGQYEHAANTSIVLQGQHGVLTVTEDGTYSYQASGESYGIEKFEYILNSIHGTSQSAELVINVGKNMTGSKYDDVITTSVANDSFTMGAGADSVIFNVLSDDNVGGNGHDTWHDFNMSEGDKINVSDLLSTDTTLSEAITLTEDVDGNVVLNIDRDGAAGTTYQSESFLTLVGVTKTANLLDELLQGNHLI